MKQLLNKKGLFFSILVCYLFSIQVFAVDYKFNFNNEVKYKNYLTVSSSTKYGQNSIFGYDFNTVQNGKDPFFFSVDLPEGNYKVELVLGSSDYDSDITIKSESRRLMLENIRIAKDEFVTKEIVVNIRNPKIGADDSVRLKPREIGKLNWDNKLTLEINGVHPTLARLVITPISVPTIFLAGNSTVVDQDDEPWCGWGQILPRFMNAKVAVANYAESGEAANSFVSAKRFKKILSKMKKGDYLIIEFGHNDQKQKGESKGPYTSYKSNLKYLVDETRRMGGIPILVSPMHRRRFDEAGKIINTHGEYPDAVRLLAQEDNVYFIDLTPLSQRLYEAWGVEESKKAFVHYPARTFPNQDAALEDNTHFNTFGGYEITKCILSGIIENSLPLKKYIVKEFRGYNPDFPDRFDDFHVPATPFSSVVKPDGD